MKKKKQAVAFLVDCLLVWRCGASWWSWLARVVYVRRAECLRAHNRAAAADSSSGSGACQARRGPYRAASSHVTKRCKASAWEAGSRAACAAAYCLAVCCGCLLATQRSSCGQIAADTAANCFWTPALLAGAPPREAAL
ncbi:hypothetical protein [Paenibacillus algorifonticola]|uniref:hypothetical protein n=1 Tax=Paenibacillus algorifonticola TaxID=684063 RepID=UPI001E435F24|nr:hypothetical protein [Paenibacillus algorifonticola]